MKNNKKQTTLVWFRKDLRLADNPVIKQAAEHGQILPVYIFDTHASTKMGGASQWWLQQALQSLNQNLDNKLNFYQGKPEQILLKIAQQHKITEIYFNTIFEPEQLAQDKATIDYLAQHQINCTTFQSQLLWLPATTVKADKTAYKVFTPFYRNGCLQSIPPHKPVAKPEKLDLIYDHNNTTSLQKINFDSDSKEKNYAQFWDATEAGGHKKLTGFINDGLHHYQEQRDIPGISGTSRLSPYLHFGQISPHQIWHAALGSKAPAHEIDSFLRQLGWREFSYNLLYHFPTLPEKNFQSKFDGFSWLSDTQLLHAWQQGKTGYPIVDAGMRELAQTGYMHNRVRMIVASFLVKNLLLHWHHGRDWFWDKLVDADLANNSASWQWVAGCGVDAAPYFRIFNPVLQGEKFDKQGDYTRKFVPELANMPDKFLHKPWLAPEKVLQESGIVLGKTYPKPIIDLDASRKRALAAYKNL